MTLKSCLKSFTLNLHEKAGGVINDLESFDLNIPPLTNKFSVQYYQNQLLNQCTLNYILRDKIKDVEKELFDLHMQYR